MAEISRHMQDISETIRQKERELHEIHDLRCAQLERMVEERDQLISEASKKFELMKDDFNYNLALIDARDKEIDKLENLVKTQQQKLQEIQDEKRVLVQQLEIEKKKELERVSKHDQEKINNRNILDELKEVIESMRWSHEEENRSKQRELDHLKAEIHHIHLIKAESLESQRRDLTTTFEGLLQQREDAYITKEKEIADQVMLLDNRFNQLHNTNIKLKNELRDATHQIEKLTEEVGMKEEQRRKVEWLLDDERASRHLLDNQLQRKYDELLLNYTNAAENHNKDNKKNQHLLDQLKEDLSREKDFRLVLEKRLEEARNVARQDISTLENELLERKNMEKLLRSELTNLKEERDVAIGRVSSSRLEADNVSSRARTLSVERNQLHKELDSSASKIRVLEDELKRVSEDYISYREETEKKELHQQQRATNELLENKSELLERMEELKKSHAEELKYVKDMYELNYIRKSDSTEAELKGTIAELQTKLSLLTKELQDTNRQISNLHKDLDDEKSNCSALKLRLELCESQKVTLQQELKKSQSYSSNSNRPNSSKIFLAANSPPFYVKKSNFDIDQGISYNINDRMDDIEVPSPIFSEDFGPVSIPSSPALPYNYSGAPRFFAADNSNIKDNYGSWNNNNSTDSHEKARLGTSAANEYARNNQIANVIANSKLPSEQKNYNQHNQRFDNTNSAADNKIDHLIDENTRLKNEVKKMRSDIEQLQSIPSPQKHATGPSPSEQNPSSSSKLLVERKLQLELEENDRLRKTIKKLMEVGNDLRSNLHKQMSEKEEFAGEYPEEFAGVSEHVLLNPNFDWISSDAPSSVSSISPHREAKDSTKFSKSLRDKLPTKKNSSSNSKDDSSSSDHIWGSNRSRFNNRRTEKLRSEPEESKKSKIVNNEAMDVSKPDKGLSGTVAQYSENESMKIVPSSSDAKEKNSDKIDDGCVMRSSRESLGSSHFESIDGIIGTSTANWRNHGGYAVPTSNSARMTKSQKEARERILISQRHLLQGTNSKDGYSPRRVVNYSRPESFDIN